MGCGASTVTPDGEEKDNGNNANEQKASVKSSSHVHQNGNTKLNQSKNKSTVDKNANKLKSLAPQAPVPKSVAFDVTLDGEIGSGLLSVKKRPPRLQALEPLNLPTLTPEQLAEKQRVADEKREKIKFKKISQSQKTSKRRNDLMKAREFGLQQQMDQDKGAIDESLRQAEMKREQKLLEVKEKQRVREERAKRARERAKRIQNPEEEIEVEKDMEFNGTSDHDDSWLGGTHGNNGDELEIDDEEEEHGLQKRVSSVRQTVSASTVDSYDAAFTRQNTDEKISRRVRPAQRINEDTNDDDFFGS